MSIQPRWPSHLEIKTHLQLTPWILLPFEFNSHDIINEANRLQNSFIIHRPDMQSSSIDSHWKSLALRSCQGDINKTGSAENYGLDSSTYKNTHFMDQCSKTKSFLNLITDIDECHRIRFMLLEPGAEINLHSDAPDKKCSLAINIALNNPKGCDFWTDLNPDGSVNRYSKKIPLSDNCVFLFNTSTYHKVVNNSTQPRMHMIIHGPLRLDEIEIINTARLQNKISSYRELINSLSFKMWYKYEKNDSELDVELSQIGMIPQFFPEYISLAVTTEKLTDSLLAEEALQITLASLHPTEPEIVPIQFLDSWFRKQFKSGKEFCVVFAAGIYIKSTQSAFLEIVRLISKLESSGSSVTGQLISKKETLPYLHDQFFIVNLKAWILLNTEFGIPDQKYRSKFCSYEKSEENVHDDYTPFWVRATQNESMTEGVANFGSEVISGSIANGQTIHNISNQLRQQKDYIYPRSGRSENYLRVKKDILNSMGKRNEHIYVFNTEKLTIRNFNFEPDVIISPCSGFKPLSIIRQYIPSGKNFKYLFFDKNVRSIIFFKKLILCNSYSELINLIQETLFVGSDQINNTKQKFDIILKEGFENNFTNFMGCLKQISNNCDFQQIDYLVDHQLISNFFVDRRKVLFWHSNVWEYQPTKFLALDSIFKKNYRNFVEAVLKRGQYQNAWLHRDAYEVILGDNFYSPEAVFTTGTTALSKPQIKNYEEFTTNLTLPPINSSWPKT